MTLNELHTEGGIPFMIPIDISLVAVIAVMVFLFSKQLTGKTLPAVWLETLRHLGSLSLVIGAFGTLVGLFQAFGALGEIKEGLPFYVIAGGMQVALITVLYGSIVYMLAMISYLILKILGKKD